MTGELGRGELSRGELGRGELGRGELGRGELGRGELGRGELAMSRNRYHSSTIATRSVPSEMLHCQKYHLCI